MTLHSLFGPTNFGAVRLPNRIVMAPLSRMRSSPNGIPQAMASVYYAQRASAGLIIAEGTSVALHAEGFPQMPGIYTREQVAAWRRVTDAVHGAGGRMALQIVHHGRTSHSSYGAIPVGPSAVSAGGHVYTPTFEPAPHEVPRALDEAELPGIIDAFRTGAGAALDAGFDAVEIHGANGYLLDQFLQDNSNLRSDGYGGSVDNRARLLLEVVDAVGREIGLDRTGVRLSPLGLFNGVADSDPVSTFTHAIGKLNERKIAWLHLIEPRASTIGLGDALHEGIPGNAVRFRAHFDGPLISAGGYTGVSASQAIEAGHADAVAFGRSFIANPDLVERLLEQGPLNAYDRATFYGGGVEGYTDYPLRTGTPATV